MLFLFNVLVTSAWFWLVFVIFGTLSPLFPLLYVSLCIVCMNSLMQLQLCLFSWSPWFFSLSISVSANIYFSLYSLGQGICLVLLFFAARLSLSLSHMQTFFLMCFHLTHPLLIQRREREREREKERERKREKDVRGWRKRANGIDPCLTWHWNLIFSFFSSFQL